MKGGTAILVPDQYRGVYKIDTHGGKRRYTALCQRLGPVKIWRDNNRDRIPDYEGPIHEGHSALTSTDNGDQMIVSILVVCQRVVKSFKAVKTSISLWRPATSLLTCIPTSLPIL